MENKLVEVTDIALEVADLGKCYQLFDKPHHRLLSYFFPRYQKQGADFWALRHISFSLAQGETVGIVGRNGSGKSSLLQMVAGTLASTTGTIQRKGRIAALLELGAGFNPEFTGRENVLLNAAIYGLSTTEIQSKLADIIAFADIGDFIDQPVLHYSSGMFVRLAFAVIAHVDADVLIVDEALAVGDAAFVQKCMRFLESFKRQGAILFVSHDTGIVTQLCDRAIWLDQGKLRLEGDAKTVSEAYLEHIYATQQTVNVSLAKGDDTVSPTDVPDFEPWHDARQDFLTYSNVRNDISVTPFDPDVVGFGTGKAEIKEVVILDQSGRPLSWLVGGEPIVLSIRFTAKAQLEGVIVGFLVKNRKGQVLFGDNNYLTDIDTPVTVAANTDYVARFGITMPYLPEDDYVISSGIASGPQADHIQHCWRHDALVFSVTQGHVVHGLMGIPLGFCDILPVEHT